MIFDTEEKNFLALETENRRLQNKFLDLEFQAAEAEIKNTLLKNKISKNNSGKTENKENKETAKINELRRKLASVRHESRDSQLLTESLERKLQNYQKNFSFLEIELEELERTNQSEQLDSLQQQLSQKEEEIESNKQMLDVLEREETLLKTRAADLKETLGIVGPYKAPQEQTWSEKPALRENLISARTAAAKVRDALNEAEDELQKLTNDSAYGTYDEKGLARAIFLELTIGKGSSEREVEAAIATEKAISEELNEELESVRVVTQAIKAYREKCYEREKKQYDIAVSQQWLETLQQQLDAN